MLSSAKADSVTNSNLKLFSMNPPSRIKKLCVALDSGIIDHVKIDGYVSISYSSANRSDKPFPYVGPFLINWAGLITGNIFGTMEFGIAPDLTALGSKRGYVSEAWLAGQVRNSAWRVGIIPTGNAQTAHRSQSDDLTSQQVSSGALTAIGASLTTPRFMGQTNLTSIFSVTADLKTSDSVFKFTDSYSLSEQINKAYRHGSVGVGISYIPSRSVYIASFSGSYQRVPESRLSFSGGLFVSNDEDPYGFNGSVNCRITGHSSASLQYSIDSFSQRASLVYSRSIGKRSNFMLGTSYSLEHSSPTLSRSVTSANGLSVFASFSISLGSHSLRMPSW